MSAELAYPIVCVGIPKTMDNDLPITDCSPAFGSVAKYAATSPREAAFDLAAMSRTSTKVFTMEVMGRHAGWTTAACALAAEHEGDAPHVLLLPEVEFNEERFLAKVEEALERYDHLRHRRVGECQGTGRRVPFGIGLEGFLLAIRSWAASHRSSPI